MARRQRPKLMDLTEFDSIQTEAEFLVASFRRRYGFPLAPPVPVEMIAKALCGLRREFGRLGHIGNEMLGALWADGRVILVDDRCSHRQRYLFTVGHEIGHWVLHEGNGAHRLDLSEQVPVTNLLGSMSARTKEERARLREVEANRFAAALLMPRSFLVREAENRQVIDEAAIAELARVFDVSMSAMLFRIKDLGKHLRWTGPRMERDALSRLEETLKGPPRSGNQTSAGRSGQSLADEYENRTCVGPAEQSQRRPAPRESEAMRAFYYLAESSQGEFAVRLSSPAKVSFSAVDRSRGLGDGCTEWLGSVAENLAEALESYHRAQNGARDAEEDSENERKAPVIVEVAGTPNAGKDTLIEIIKDYLEDGHGRRVRVFDEATKFCHIGRQLDADRLFKTVAQTVAQLHEARFENPGGYDFIIFNRGLFDRVALVRATRVMGGISQEQERIHTDYLLSYARLQDLTFLFLISGEESLRRERERGRASLEDLYSLRDGRSADDLRRQSIMAPDTLAHLNKSYLQVFSDWKEVFDNRVYLFDFTESSDASIIEKARALADATLPRDSSQLLLPELFGVYYTSGESSTGGKGARRRGSNRKSNIGEEQPWLFRTLGTPPRWVKERCPISHGALAALWCCWSPVGPLAAHTAPTLPGGQRSHSTQWTAVQK